MRVHWFSNSPYGSTGYSNQTRLFTPRIKALGHEVSMTAFWGLAGAVLNWEGMPIYPAGLTEYSQDVVAANSVHVGADITITLMDAWVCQPEMYGSARWVPWFPVDCEPLPRIIAEKIKKSFQPSVYSKFGQRMALDAGIDRIAYIPHGVDTNMFRPGDKLDAREKIHLPKDKFIVGMVAANKGAPSRKCLPQCIQAFAQFHAKHPDSLLYLHTTKSEHGEFSGVNLPELLAFHGLSESDVIFVDQYMNHLGAPNPYMVAVYQSLDVLLSPSMGEGFGIPILEAQACGTPVIVGDWTAMSELCFAGWSIPKEESEPFWTPLASYQFVPRLGSIVQALEDAYAADLSTMRAPARDGALVYDADLVTEKYWRPFLDGVNDRIELNKRLRSNNPITPPADLRQLSIVR